MRLFGILLLCCFTFGAVSAFSWSQLFPRFSGNPNTIMINLICPYLANHPDRANSTIQKINETLEANSQTQEKFASTIAFLNTPANQQNLVGGTSTCPTFFSGLNDAIQADLNNANGNFNDNKQQAVQILTNALNQLKALFNFN